MVLTHGQETHENQPAETLAYIHTALHIEYILYLDVCFGNMQPQIMSIKIPSNNHITFVHKEMEF